MQLTEAIKQATARAPETVKDAGAQISEAVKETSAQVSRTVKGTSAQVSRTVRTVPIRGEDVARWMVFTAFWGSVSYLYTCIGQIVGTRRDSVRVHTPTVGLAYGVHVLSFVVGGSLVVAISSIVRGKRSTDRSAKAISSGKLERGWPLQALGGTAGSVLTFGLALASQSLVSQRTGHTAVAEEVNLPVAGGAMVVLSGLTAFAVARITAWVAQDAKSH